MTSQHLSPMKHIHEQIAEIKKSIKRLELQLVTGEVPEETVIQKIEAREKLIEELEKKLESWKTLTPTN
jgi:ribosomal protein L29